MSSSKHFKSAAGKGSPAVVVRANNVDQAMKILKRGMQKEGVWRKMKQEAFYEKPSEEKARKKAEAVKRRRKTEKKKAKAEGMTP